MKIAQIIGSRPNLTKFINVTGKDIVIWTGQHYSTELHCKKVTVTYKLNQIELGQMTSALIFILLAEKPDCIVVYGDTRSALAGALASHELDIPLAHCEAGIRLGDMSRPEERIRRVVDHLSDYLFCVNDFHAENLERENIAGQIFIVGDLHYDRYLQSRPHKGYILATIHRAENTNTKEALKCALKKLKRPEGLIFPVHPRTLRAMKTFNLRVPENVKMVPPLSYTDMQQKIREAKLVITDSGGVCREAWFAGTPVEFIGDSEWESEIRMFGDGNAEGKIRNILLRELKLCQKK